MYSRSDVQPRRQKTPFSLVFSNFHELTGVVFHLHG
jgi:hypothetical protein